MSEQKRPLTRKERKKLQHKKNLYHQKIYDAVRKRLGEQKRIKDILGAQEKDRKKRRSREEEERKKSDDKKEVWSVQVSTIRNRLTGHKRLSEERWNRFAGTEDGGGRGR